MMRALLQDLPAEWTSANEGAGTWSPHEVVAHLIHGEKADWIPRARIILAGDDTATFTPFEREGGFAEARRQPINSLLQTFARLRAENLRILTRLEIGDEQLDMAARHPTFGRVTMRQLLATWVVHDLNHLAQISRVMSKQYDQAVGPWKEFLGVLK
jgi:uncharacterized damage-inducible protein DinB